MNTKTLISIIAPYLLLACLFAAMAQQAQYGFFQPTEDGIALVLGQLEDGVFPTDSTLGSSLSSAVLLVPLHRLWVADNGAADGFVYFLRICITALSFAVALACFQIGRRDGYRNLSLVVASAIVLLCSVRILGATQGLAVVFLAVSGLCAWCARSLYLADDGAQTGYARVLLPFFAGVFLCFAFLCSWLVILPVAAVVVRGVSNVVSRKRSLIPFAWAISGIAVALIVLAIYLLGFQNPFAALSIYVKAIFSDAVVPSASIEGVFSGLSAACGVGALALTFGTTLVYDANRLTQRYAHVLAWGVLVLCIAAQGFWLLSTHSDCTVPVGDGPAANLVVSEDNAALYRDAQHIAYAVGDDEVEVKAGNAWMGLLFSSPVDNGDQALWLFVADDFDIEDEELSLEGYGIIMENSSGVLYRSAGRESFIAQG